MRTITLIVVHCSAVRPNQRSSAEDIDKWHKDRGFKGIGYHYVIRRDGTIEPGRPEWMIGAHCHVAGQNHNKYSIGVCYEGGLDIRGQPADTRTAEQKQTMRRLLVELHERYPRAVIVGHHDLNPFKAAIKREQNQTCLDFAEREQARPKVKDCPCIKDVAKEYADLQPK